MTKFNITIDREECREITIDAESFEEAVQIANENCGIGETVGSIEELRESKGKRE